MGCALGAVRLGEGASLLCVCRICSSWLVSASRPLKLEEKVVSSSLLSPHGIEVLNF